MCHYYSSITKLRLSYRRQRTNMRVLGHPGTTTGWPSFTYNEIPEQEEVDDFAATLWAPGFPARQPNASLNYATYLSAHHDYRMVTDKAVVRGSGAPPPPPPKLVRPPPKPNPGYKTSACGVAFLGR